MFLKLHYEIFDIFLSGVNPECIWEKLTGGPTYRFDSTEDGRTFLCLGLPSIVEMFNCGTSSPAIPAFINPDP